MHLVLDPAQDSAHGEWLRRTPGAYEWWYFDAVSDDGAWALVCIWFLGNPFSPYYRHAARGEAADPYTHNAVFFALYRQGRLHAYHFTRFPRGQVCADEVRPSTLRFGANTLTFDGRAYRLSVADENANRRVLTADLTFLPPLPTVPVSGRADGQDAGGDHFWMPAAPVCRVTGRIGLRGRRDCEGQVVAFSGDGYHDHNWGTLPFAADIRDWYWARASLGNGRALILYHVDYHRPRPPVSHLLLFDRGQLVRHDPQARVAVSRRRRNVFGVGYATRLDAQSDGLAVSFTLGSRLDSSPFYIRALCRADTDLGGNLAAGTGIAEYFRPQALSWWLTASATRARIVAP